MKYKTVFKREEKTEQSFTHLNTRYEQIFHEVLHLHNILTPPPPKTDVMGPEPRKE